MSENTITAPIEAGDVVRVVTDADTSFVAGAGPGDTFRVDSVSPPLQPDDDGYGDRDYVQESFVEGWAERGTVTAPLSALELVRSCADVAAKGAPTIRDITDGLTFDGDSVLDFDESYTSGNQVEFVVRDRQTGLRYSFTVTVSEPREAD